MGTTIRRQPLSFPIPASPDYKFLNITDFGGLNISSNPFVVSSNTASDCLNVYVDEDNALSTRPRLQLKYDLMSLAGLDNAHELIDIYNLHNGYLLHTKKGLTGYMYRFEEDEGVLKSPDMIAGTKPINKCKLFEQNGLIYLLDGLDYYRIRGTSISVVEGYIPTTTAGKNRKTITIDSEGNELTDIDRKGTTLESLNLLSNKYRESYYWDGVWDYNSLKLTGSETIINSYRNVKRVAVDGSVLIGGLTQPIKNEYCLLYKNEIRFYTSYGEQIQTKTLDVLTDYPEDASKVNDGLWYASYDGTTIIHHTSTDKMLAIYTRSDTESTTFTKHNVQLPIDATYHYVQGINKDGSRLVLYNTYSNELIIVRRNESGVYSAVIPTYNNKTTNFDGLYIAIHPTKNILLTAGGEDLAADYRRTSVLMLDLSDNEGEYAATRYELNLPDVYDITSMNVAFSPIDNKMLLSLQFNTEEYTGDIPNRTCVTLYYPDYTKASDYQTLYTKTARYNNEPLIYNSIWSSDGTVVHIDTGYVLMTENPIIFQDMGYSWGSDTSDPSTYGYYATNTELVVYPSELILMQFDFESSEPKLFVTRNIEAYVDLPDSYDTGAALIRKAKLFERFDNNTWFASKNYTFHTLYNDPTYIPLSSYNDLGEDFEEITGLSIVNDNVLAAYKRNRIYIITPVTVGNQETYSYTETKNVIGNDVLDAPILTILTEMPTIVSYDGIYALNQLENVQSSDRITTLISENINPRWLKESSEDIDNCKTLNRLYWTYYILPHRKNNDETTDYTKIYLLDNRTQQWYYWELPIYVINAMVKDNKTHFVNEDGTIFTLEITDLIHEYNPDVTEYYDKVNDEKLIIPWYWTSQILSLSTINYSKKLVDTTFILTDTDTQDEYGLDYSFKAWRKSVSETNATTISNNIHYVQSTTKRTMIPRFNFIQIKLSNTAEDLDNNKLRLVGLGLKYVLLEGLY